MRALVLSGGGSKGAFHVGFCRRAVGELGTHYDILCGVSVGALVAAFLAQYPRGEERQAAKQLDDLFLGIRDRDVWKRWFPFGKVAGLWKPSLLNSKPLHRLVRSHLDPERVRHSGKLLRIGAVNLTKGCYHTFTEKWAGEGRGLADAVLASAAFPGFLLPLHVAGEWWTDGGVQEVTPIKAAIDAGATAIDVVIADPRGAVARFEREPEALDVLVRAVELMAHRLTWVDVLYARRINELVDAGKAPGKRKIDIRVFAPAEELNRDSLHFDPREATEIAMKGYQVAVESELSDGP